MFRLPLSEERQRSWQEVAVKQGWPVARAGMAVGLLGGSFDPPHSGHVHVTREALKRFGLDRVWWLVSPGNPLKARGPAPIARRIAAARAVISDSRVVITDLEARLGTRFTAETLDRLRVRYPGVLFVWIMGADNLAGFHRWDRWQHILSTVPVGVVARPGSGMAARYSPAARRFAAARLPQTASSLLALRSPPVWCMVEVPRSPASSTALRANGAWP